MFGRVLRALVVCATLLTVLSIGPQADTIQQAVPFAQSWVNTDLLTAANDWSGVPGIIGYRGDGLVNVAGSNPQLLVADGSATPVNVIANQTSPNTLTTGGVAEFHLADPVVALQGSGTADAPHLVITVSTAGLSNVSVAYNVRDIDGSADNAVQQVALQYRAGTTGEYTNLPAGFVADATTGGSATQVTPVNVILPPAVANQSIVQLRIITTDAAGSDEWIGIDDIRIDGSLVAEPTNPTGTGAANPSTVLAGGTTTVTINVSPGTNPTSTSLSVSADLRPIAGSATQPFFDDGTNGDVTAGDNTFSYVAAIPATLASGEKTITATVLDAQLRSSTTSVHVNVVEPAPRGVVISQVYGGGGNAGARFANDFIELFNRTAAPVNLGGWSVQYTSAGGSTWQTTALTGVIAPNSYYLVAEAAGSNANAEALPPPEATGAISMGAGSGKVAIANTTTALTGGCPVSSAFVVDFVGYGSANCFEGAGATKPLSNTTAALRLDGGDVDTDQNATDFIVGAPNPHNHEGVPPRGTGAALPQAISSGGTALLTVAVTPGERPVNTNISVTGDLSAIGGAVDATFFDDGTNGDQSAHDNVFSLSTTVAGTPGVKTLPIRIRDTVPRTGTGTIALAIETTTIAIHNIQGSGRVSPFADVYVTTQGIVTGLKFNGVFIQTRDGDTDADDLTSDGLFVFTGGAPPAFLAAGHEVFVSGTVQEFVPQADPESPPVTEIGNAFFRVAMMAQPLPRPVPLLPSYTVPAGNFEQLERFEGMRVTANVVAISPTQGAVDELSATSTSTGLFHAVIHGVARPLREPGLEPDQTLPAGAPAGVPRFDGNPERLRVDSDALIGAPTIEIVSGQTISGLTGPLDYGFRSYTILPDPPSVSGMVWTPTGNAAAIPVPIPSTGEFTVGHFNLERFFDSLDDPAVDDAVLTTDALNARLAKASVAIRHVLRSPDILGVVEVENLPVLQRLAEQISADARRAGEADPNYEAFLEEGNDIGGIDVGFLVKAAVGRVVRPLTQIGKDATYVEPGGRTAVLNDRPSLLLEAVLTGPLGNEYPVTVIVNHLRSLSGIDGDDGERIRAKRQAQAEFLARYIQSRQATNPDERIISVGDYNAFQFSDGYVDVMGTIEGRPAPPDQVVRASADLVNPDLTNAVDSLPAAERYSFTFDGNAQAIDHVLVNGPAERRFSRMAYARLDADFPESLRNDVTRPERVSDHDAAIAYFQLGPIVTLNGDNPMRVEAFTAFTDPGAAAIDRGPTPDQDRVLPVNVEGAVDVNTPGIYTLIYTASNGFSETRVERTVIVTDTSAPVIEGFFVSPSSIWPPNHKLVDVTLTYVASDASRAVTCAPSVSSNEAPNGTDDGNTAIDTNVVDGGHVQVRAERSGTGRDRIYAIALTCTDASGNSATETRTVAVPKSR